MIKGWVIIILISWDKRHVGWNVEDFQRKRHPFQVWRIGLGWTGLNYWTWPMTSISIWKWQRKILHLNLGVKLKFLSLLASVPRSSSIIAMALPPRQLKQKFKKKKYKWSRAVGTLKFVGNYILIICQWQIWPFVLILLNFLRWLKTKLNK